MKKKRFIIIGAIIIAVASMALIAYQEIEEERTALQAVATNKISIQGYTFMPEVIKVQVNTSVTWINNDAVEHTLNSYDGSMAGSHFIPKGQTYSHTFTTPGKYEYHSTFYPNMTGMVEVNE